jgi:hypothetical protein
MAAQRRGAPRRQFGSIEQLPSGQWRVRYRVDGQSVSPGLTFATRAEAAAYLDAARAELDRPNRPNPRDGQRQFGDWATEYMATKVDLAPRTAAGYDSMLNNHILPAFATMAINTIRPLTIRRFLADLAENGLGPIHRRWKSWRRVSTGLGASLGAKKTKTGHRYSVTISWRADSGAANVLLGGSGPRQVPPWSSRHTPIARPMSLQGV